MKRAKISSLGYLIALFLVTISGCKKNDNKSAGPAIPPTNTFEMDLNSLPGKTKSAAADLTVSDSGNWKIASFTVGFWAVAAGIYTVVPAVAFKAVINNSKPTFDDVNQVWVWKVQFTYASGTHEAELTGKLSEDSVHWVMNITTYVNTPSQYTDKWFEGTADYGRTGGWWILYYKPTGTEIWKVCLKLDWKRESDNVGYLKYTNVIQGDANNGGYIKFASVATGDFDKYFEAKSISSSNHDLDGKVCLIEWNSTAKNGRITVDAGGANPQKYCWDNTLKNTTCP
jgi:hypothetical protein